MTTIRLIGSGFYTFLHVDYPIVPWDGSDMNAWDAATTTPFRLASNDVAGEKWRPQSAPKQVLWSGGPPMTDGRLPIGQSVDTVTESIVIQGYAVNHQDAITLKQLIEQRLSLAYYDAPMMLEYNDGSGAAYYEILSADTQEDSRYIHDEAGRGLIRIVITWVRSPFATPGNGNTVLNAISLANTGNDLKSLGALYGELLYLGQPLNLTFSGGAFTTAGVRNLWIASVYNTTFDTPNYAFSTTSTSGVAVWSTATASAALLAATKLRILARVASPSANLQLRVVVTWGGDTIYTGAWITGGSTSGAIYDLGYLDFPPAARRNGGSTSLSYTIYARSTNGSAATGTLSWRVALNYLTFCKITANSYVGAVHRLLRYIDTSNGCRILNPPVYSTVSGVPSPTAILAGQAPLAYQNASLWIVWDSAGAHDNTATATLTASYVPLYRTLIGPGVV